MVVPYLRVCGPPEFSAAFPPSVQASWLDGSGAKKRPCGAAALPRSAFTTPGCTTAMRFSASTLRMRFRREHSITTPFSSAIAPPESPVPAPRGTKGTPCARQARTTRATSVLSLGSTTAEGSAPWTVRPSAS